jgi:hypothetical protein
MVSTIEEAMTAQSSISSEASSIGSKIRFRTQPNNTVRYRL